MACRALMRSPSGNHILHQEELFCNCLSLSRPATPALDPSISMGKNCLEAQGTQSCEASRTLTSQELLSEASESFNCSICLELVYKPIVQACGHIFCFWCVFQAMNYQRESHCPVCRRPYMYFPRVCELLHFMLSKAVPEEYERRGREIQRTEEEKQVFSPRFLESPRHLWSPRYYEDAAGLKAQITSSSSTLRIGTWANGSCANGGCANGGCPNGTDTRDVTAPAHNHGQDNIQESVQMPLMQSMYNIQGSTLVPERKEIDSGHRDQGGLTQNILTVEDFLCSSCHGLLYRPVVLNCGEVFCESCLKKSTSTVLRCPSCRDPHPGGSALICLELHQYLETAFPAEYMKRKQDAKHQESAEKIQSVGCNSGDVGDGGTEGLLHMGVGCDACGMFPIVGDRYCCRECTEKIGFDLCGTCYNKEGSFFGRFNQEHRSSHRMDLIKPLFQQRLVLNMQNSSLQRRRQQQQTHTIGDLDDYISSFVD